MNNVKIGLIALLIVAGASVAYLTLGGKACPVNACCPKDAKCCCVDCGQPGACQSCACLEKCKEQGCLAK